LKIQIQVASRAEKRQPAWSDDCSIMIEDECEANNSLGALKFNIHTCQAAATQ
jgi:hypothetical protein